MSKDNMEELQRWSMEIVVRPGAYSYGNESVGCEHDPDGEWVRFSDVEELVARFQARIEELAAEFQSHADEPGDDTYGPTEWCINATVRLPGVAVVRVRAGLPTFPRGNPNE